MHICPNCLEPKLVTDDPEKSDWVARGTAVCSRECRQEVLEQLPLFGALPDDLFAYTRPPDHPYFHEP